MKERVLITGASGLLGSSLGVKLSKLDQDVLGIRRSNPRPLPFPEIVLDLQDYLAVQRLAREFKPTTVVHAAALSKVLECESNPRGAYAQNVEVTKLLLDAASEVGAHVIFISTDQVFDGKKAYYSESDAPAPTHVYGKTKRDAELLVYNASESNLILRSNNIVGRNSGWGRSFSDGLLDQIRNSCAVSLFDDQYRSPVHLTAMVSIVAACIGNRIHGILHAGGPERLSRFDTGLALAKAYKFSPDLLTPVSMTTHPNAATMHSDGSFCTDKLCSLFPKIGITTITEGFVSDAAMEI